MIRRMSKLRFDALVSYTRHPAAQMTGEEIKWFSSDDERVVGTVVRDLADGDFAGIVLGRDQDRRFRWIDMGPWSGTASGATWWLIQALERHSASGQDVFPQAADKPKMRDLFAPVVPPERLHPAFRLLVESTLYSPALGIMGEMAHHFQDPDGNFVQQFQTDGFDARLWELYLFAALTELNFQLDRTHPAPDFSAVKFGKYVCIEAVTANPTQGAEPPTTKRTPDEIQSLLRNVVPIKFGGPLFDKLRKRYWERPHVQGNPLLLAIQDFHEPGSMVWTHSALPTYLYGMDASFRHNDDGDLVVEPVPVAEHVHGPKRVPSGFFFLPDAENISAVLFSNSGTISKFNRMGYLAGFGSRLVNMVRQGTCYLHDRNAAAPSRFRSAVHEEGYSETWAEGLSMFHNPRARVPADPELFPDIAHHRFENGLIRSVVPRFHPFGSHTFVFPAFLEEE